MNKTLELSDFQLKALSELLEEQKPSKGYGTTLWDIHHEVEKARAIPFPVIFPVTGRHIPERVHEAASRMTYALHEVEPRWGIISPSSLRQLRISIGVSEQLQVEVTGIIIT